MSKLEQYNKIFDDLVAVYIGDGLPMIEALIKASAVLQMTFIDGLVKRLEKKQ